MTGRHPFDREQALDNLTQAVNYLTNLHTLLPQTLSTDLDVLRLMRCFGYGKATYQLWNRLRVSPIPADADGLILGLMLPMATQLATIREGLKQPPFSSDPKCVHQATRLFGAAHGVLVRLVRLVGVRTIDTQLSVLDEWLGYATASKNSALFEWCLSRRRELYAEYRPDLDVEAWNQIDRAALLHGQTHESWPIDLIPLLCYWAGELEGMDDYSKALGFGEAALRIEGERSITQEKSGREQRDDILKSAIFLSKPDALKRAFKEGLQAIGKEVRTRQRLEALADLPERASQHVARTRVPADIRPLDDSISSIQGSTNPLDELVAEEDRLELESAIDRLPLSQRRAVLMKIRSADESRELRTFFQSDREYKTAHDNLRAARKKLARSRLDS